MTIKVNAECKEQHIKDTLHKLFSAGVVVTIHKVELIDNALNFYLRFNVQSHQIQSVVSVFDAAGEDCIAAYDSRMDKGWLLGQRAAKWGEFDKRFFVL